MDDIKLIYLLIGEGSKPLADYSRYQGEFIEVCEKTLKRVEPNKSSMISTPEYKIFYLNEDNITYLMMTMP